jgi:hypothetical protein
MRRSTFPTVAACLCISFISAWILGYALVLESGRSLVARERILSEAGYPSVPGPFLEAESGSGQTCLAAGLFYAATLGVGLPALLLPATALIRSRTSIHKSIPVWTVPVLMLAGFNLEGFRPWESLYALGTGGWLALWVYRDFSPESKRRRNRTAFLGIAGAALLTISICGIFGIRDFKGFRDAVLLSNGPGTALSDFYYRYALAAAEPLKRPLRRTQPLALLETKEPDLTVLEHLHRKAEAQDVILLETSTQVPPSTFDWIVTLRDDAVTVRRTRGWKADPAPAPYRVEGSPLFSDEDPLTSWLGLISWLKLSVTLGLPAAFLMALSFWLRRAALAAARWAKARGSAPGDLLLAIIGLGACAFLLLKPYPMDPDVWVRGAAYDYGWSRVRALRALAESNTDMLDGRFLTTLLENPDPRLRYWAACAVTAEQGHETVKPLIRNLQSPRIHVAAAAAAALGRLNRPNAVAALARAFAIERRWYLRDTIYRVFQPYGNEILPGFLSSRSGNNP